MLAIVAIGPSAVIEGPITIRKAVTLFASLYTFLSVLGFFATDDSDEDTLEDEVRTMLENTSAENPMSTQEIADTLRRDRQPVVQILARFSESGEIKSTRTQGGEFYWWAPTRVDEIVENQAEKVDELVFWTDEGRVNTHDEWTDFEYEEAVLLYLVGKYYASRDSAVEDSWVTWGELVNEIDYDQRIKRSVAEALDSESVLGFVEESTRGTERVFRIRDELLPEILDRIKEPE